MALVLLIATNSTEILDLLFGKEYMEAHIVLSIHIIGGNICFSAIASSKWFIIEGLQIMTLRRTTAGAIINIILNIILIPIYGIVGAAIATVISQIIASYLFNLIILGLEDFFSYKQRLLC